MCVYLSWVSKFHIENVRIEIVTNWIKSEIVANFMSYEKENICETLEKNSIERQNVKRFEEIGSERARWINWMSERVSAWSSKSSKTPKNQTGWKFQCNTEMETIFFYLPQRAKAFAIFLLLLSFINFSFVSVVVAQQRLAWI